MTKQGYIEFRRGRAACKAGDAYNPDASHEWRMGYLIAEMNAKH